MQGALPCFALACLLLLAGCRSAPKEPDSELPASSRAGGHQGAGVSIGRHKGTGFSSKTPATDQANAPDNRLSTDEGAVAVTHDGAAQPETPASPGSVVPEQVLRQPTPSLSQPDPLQNEQHPGSTEETRRRAAGTAPGPINLPAAADSPLTRAPNPEPAVSPLNVVAGADQRHAPENRVATSIQLPVGAGNRIVTGQNNPIAETVNVRSGITSKSNPQAVSLPLWGNLGGTRSGTETASSTSSSAGKNYTTNGPAVAMPGQSTQLRLGGTDHGRGISTADQPARPIPVDPLLDNDEAARAWREEQAAKEAARRQGMQAEREQLRRAIDWVLLPKNRTGANP